MNDYNDLTFIRTTEPTPTVLALCDSVEWMRDRLTELGDMESMERFHPRQKSRCTHESQSGGIDTGIWTCDTCGVIVDEGDDDE